MERILYYSIEFKYDDMIKLIQSSLPDITFFIKKDDKIELYDGSVFELEPATLSLASHIEKLKNNDVFIIYNKSLYVLNPEFHITTLFTGGKPHEHTAEMETLVNSEVIVKINKIALSSNFIVFGVETIQFEDDSDIPYYGNPIKHITIALNKSGKRVFPKDSYTALTDIDALRIIELNLTIQGKCSKVK
jgi:hypothetical protein